MDILPHGVRNALEQRIGSTGAVAPHRSVRQRMPVVRLLGGLLARIV